LPETLFKNNGPDLDSSPTPRLLLQTSLIEVFGVAESTYFKNGEISWGTNQGEAKIIRVNWLCSGTDISYSRSEDTVNLNGKEGIISLAEGASVLEWLTLMGL